jgi:hypothetical protein
MDSNIPPDLHLQVRKIRNIEVWKCDLLPLINGQQKIPSTPINAFGAQLQEYDQDRDYTIFSSWLGAFASGQIKEGWAEGTFKEHMKAAVRAREIQQKPLTYLSLSACRTHWKNFWHHENGFYLSAGEAGFCTGYLPG